MAGDHSPAEVREPELDAVLDEMVRRPAPDIDAFYCFTLTADNNGKVFLGCQSQWVGFKDEDRRIEMREASLMSIEVADHWEKMGQPCLFVMNVRHLSAFMLVGGHALVDPSVASEHLADLLKPKPSYQIGERGFVGPGLMNPIAFKRAPTPKLRMQVLNRDGRRCRICGRNPDDNSDLVLDVHHIRPWANAGWTDIANLITLCHTCHRGLDPHFDPTLYSYLKKSRADIDRAYLEGVSNYRRAAAAGFSILSANA